MKQQLVSLARRLSAPFLFRRSLPSDFGREKMFVSSRADIRLLAAGLERVNGDLFTMVRNYVKPNDVVWDIGSNLGEFTFSSAIRVGRGGSVFSLEADPHYADIQSQTLRGFTRNAGKISILCAAVADRSDISDLVITKKGHKRNHLSVVEGNCAGEAETTKPVVTVTLDWLLQRWGEPNFIKIDIEGAEVLAVIGGRRLFSSVRPTGYIECSDCNADTMTDFFKQLDYDLFSLDSSGIPVSTDRFAFNTVVRPK